MPIFVENELSKADSLIKVGELAEAEEIYKKVLSEFPNDKKAIQGCQELKAEIDSNRALKSEPPQEQVQELINIYTTEQYDGLVSTEIGISNVAPKQRSNITHSAPSTELNIRHRIAEIQACLKE